MTEQQLKKRFPDLRILCNVPYSEITSFGVGSAPVPLIAEPENDETLASLLKYLSARKCKVFILGAGTNVVGSDKEFDGVIIRLNSKTFSAISIEDDIISCGAFTKLPLLCSAAAKANLSGLAPLSGIPGTVGGAVKMNAGANGTETADLLSCVKGVRLDGTPWEADAKDIQWFYRGNSIPPDVVITGAKFKLTTGESCSIEEAAIAAEHEKRRLREPAGRSAGCAFRNISPFEPAGMLIDRCGLRGLVIGDLEVSSKHANYLLNTGNATEEDYICMVRILRRAVSEKFGFYLTNEIVPVMPSTNARIEEDTPPPLVNVLYGGSSSEREVSLQSGACIASALRRAGFKVELSDIRKCAISPTMQKSDVIYPALHGGFGEDGTLQNELENAKLRFVGSGSVASELIMDKLASKRLLDDIKLPTAPWAVVTRNERQFPANLHFPVMVKAPREGSTVGIVKVNSIEEWNDALDATFKYSDELLVEEFISGVEISIPILNANVLDAIEIVSPGGFYDWDAKYVYKNGKTEYFCPPRSLPVDVVKLAQEYALKFYHAARCRDILRVDFIVTAEDVPFILEGNNLPGNTEHSLVPQAAKAAGISLEKMTSSLVYAAMKRSCEPESGGGKPSGTNIVVKIMTGISRWLYRFALLVSAFLLISAGMKYNIAAPEGWPLLSGGVLLLISEFVFFWLKHMEKK